MESLGLITLSTVTCTSSPIRIFAILAILFVPKAFTLTQRLSRFAVDFLQMMAGLGCFVSSMITLLIFFPRSIVREAGYKPKVASTIPPNSPKSPPVTPPSQSTPFALHPHAVPHYQHHLPPHMAGYATPAGLRMSVTGGTGWTTTGMTGATTYEMEGSSYSYSMYSPRQSYDSPQYTADDDDDLQRRGSRVSRLSRRGSRRVSTMSGRPMDAHLEQDSDAEYEGDLEMETEREDEERVPPYSHPHPPPLLETQTSSHMTPPTQAHLHQRHPFAHSFSSPQVQLLLHSTAPSDTQTPRQQQPSATPASTPIPAAVFAASPPPPPAPAQSPPHQRRSSSPSSVSKRRTWDWEERRPSALVDERGARRSLHVITTAPGVNLGLGLVSTALAPLGTGRGAVGGGHGPAGDAARMGRAGARSSLHPYVRRLACFHI